MPNRGKNRKNERYALLDRRRQVAELYLRGCSQMEIAERLACSQPTVSNDLVGLREQWLGSALRDFDQRKAEELAKLDHLEREAWAAWGRSCEDGETRHERTEQALPTPATKGRKGRSKAQEQAHLAVVRRIIDKTTRRQVGDPRFLERVAWCIECRLKMLGVLKPDKHTNIAVNVNNIDWDAITEELARDDPDTIEERINGVLEAPANGPAVNRLENKPSNNGVGHE